MQHEPYRYEKWKAGVNNSMDDPKWEINFVCSSIIDPVGESQETDDVIKDGVEEERHCFFQCFSVLVL